MQVHRQTDRQTAKQFTDVINNGMASASEGTSLTHKEG